MNYLAFYVVILLTNVIQGITGFAGTILAMPPGLMLVGYDVAKPILNLLGLLAGIYVFLTQRKQVKWREVRKVVLVMAVGIFLGFYLKQLLTGYDGILYKLLGIFVIGLALRGYVSSVHRKRGEEAAASAGIREEVKSISLLVSSGIVHGMFVSGGPLLIGYLSKAIREKVSFRATISTIWIILNAMILVQDIHSGLWTTDLVVTQLISTPFMAVGMVIGSILVKRMSQEVFMKLTYILLFLSGILLMFK